ncbi:MAG: DUF5011 domain-containing protein [Butyrivibrio sp.]|nr:DUF5011 domain-containing protein [Butyrivibrio sp.]
MKSNILAFFFTIGSIVMAVFIVWFYNMSDRIEPEMRFSAYDLTYNGETKEADLLNGVVAYDAVDGDITDRIVVEKTILNEEQGAAVVYYAVSDMSGNVTKQSRVFNADVDSLRGTYNEFMTNAPDYEAFDDGEEGFNTEGFNTEGFTQTTLFTEGENTEGGSNSEEGSSANTQEGESTGN